MTQAKPFLPAKLISGIISSKEEYFREGEKGLIELFGRVDKQSPFFAFNFTNYYESQMGKNLKRTFLSFARLIEPERLSEIKTRTNALEEEIREKFGEKSRVINLDPGILTSSALIMATAKDFSHRIPLQNGIYAHLEFLFTKTSIRTLDWTYPDFRSEGYQEFFLEVRRLYLAQLREMK